MTERDKPRRSVRADGAKLKSLRLAAGVTQEELAELIGYSDRLIRKAEMGERIDLKSIRSLLRYFSTRGQVAELSELIVEDPEDRSHRLPKQWIDLVFQQLDFAAAANLLASECTVCVDGISIANEQLENVASWSMSVFGRERFAIDYWTMGGAWHVMGWTSIRCAADFQLDGTRIARDDKHPDGDSAQFGEEGDSLMLALNPLERDTFTVCGTTSFRVKQQKIIEIRVFSDAELYVQDYHLWLQQKTQGLGL